VGFFLGYDFNQWLRKLPEERARMLLTEEGKRKRKPKSKKVHGLFPVEYGEWQFDILGTKRFKIRKKGSKRWMSICDTGPFFQKSFLSVIDPKEWDQPVVTREEFETLTIGKSNRSGATLGSDMERYNRLENEVLSRVLERLNDGFQSLGIYLKPNQWFGPGQAAQAWLTDRAITNDRLTEVTPSPVLEAAIASYYGGWFEIFAHGVMPGVTHEYDINSAYPFIISTLPCLEHGKWIHNGDRTGRYTLVRAKVSGSNPYIGTMLHRDDKGNIYRPHVTEGWYWLHEIQAAQNAGLIDECRISDSYNYIPCDCLPPLREVRDIYNLRKKVGKKTPLGIACKLVPSSLYGKFSQSIGSPKYANPIYASLITAGCRTMILNAIATHPKGAKNVAMVATDGVYFFDPHPSLPISGDLGDWDTKPMRHLCLFKPGVYWDDTARASIRKGESPVFKARGVNARDLSKKIELIDDMFKVGEVFDIDWPAVRFSLSFSMISCIQALHRNDWTLAGTVIPDYNVVQSSNPKSKRTEEHYQEFLRGNVKIRRTSPRVNSPYEPSHPYEKRFGIDDPFGDLRAINTLDADGEILIAEALGNK
jgi:hypothetical protein